MEFCAAAAVASPAWIVPVTIPGGKPTTAFPGLTPRSPLTIVGPVLVTVDAPRTAKGPALPSGGATAIADSRPSSPAAGSRGPVGVRSGDLDEQPGPATATATSRNRIAPPRTGLIEPSPSGPGRARLSAR